MIEPTNITGTYDLQFIYDWDIDTAPKVLAYELYKEEDIWQTDTLDYVRSYVFTDEDIQWAIEKFELEDISELNVEEWFTNEDRHLVLNNLPPKAVDWVDSLPKYEYWDKKEESN